VGLTLNELKTIQLVVSWVRGDMPNLDWKGIDQNIKDAESYIEREIRLKEIDFTTMKKIKNDIKEGKVE